MPTLQQRARLHFLHACVFSVEVHTTLVRTDSYWWSLAGVCSVAHQGMEKEGGGRRRRELIFIYKLEKLRVVLFFSLFVFLLFCFVRNIYVQIHY